MTVTGNPEVLVVGFDPRLLPGVDADAVEPAFAAGRARARELDVELVECLIAPDESAVQTVTHAIAERPWASVVIGGGLRVPDDAVPLLEIVVAAVRSLAPGAVIAFNTSPVDSADAALRALEMRAHFGS